MHAVTLMLKKGWLRVPRALQTCHAQELKQKQLVAQLGGIGTGLHLLELYNMWMYKPFVVENLSFHIFRNLCELEAITVGPDR